MGDLIFDDQDGTLSLSLSLHTYTTNTVQFNSTSILSCYCSGFKINFRCATNTLYCQDSVIFITNSKQYREIRLW